MKVQELFEGTGKFDREGDGQLLGELLHNLFVELAIKRSPYPEIGKVIDGGYFEGEIDGEETEQIAIHDGSYIGWYPLNMITTITLKSNQQREFMRNLLLLVRDPDDYHPADVKRLVDNIDGIDRTTDLEIALTALRNQRTK